MNLIQLWMDKTRAANPDTDVWVVVETTLSGEKTWHFASKVTFTCPVETNQSGPMQWVMEAKGVVVPQEGKRLWIR